MNPRDASAFVVRARVKLTLEHWSEALADADEAIHLNARDAYAFAVRAQAKCMLGQHSEALADVDEAICLNPKDAGAFAFRELIKRMLGRHFEALFDADEAVRLNQGDASALYGEDYIAVDTDTSTNADDSDTQNIASVPHEDPKKDLPDESKKVKKMVSFKDIELIEYESHDVSLRPELWHSSADIGAWRCSYDPDEIVIVDGEEVMLIPYGRGDLDPL